jgi:hypothetical protein
MLEDEMPWLLIMFNQVLENENAATCDGGS